MGTIEDWNGRVIEVARSRGGVGRSPPSRDQGPHKLTQ